MNDAAESEVDSDSTDVAATEILNHPLLGVTEYLLDSESVVTSTNMTKSLNPITVSDEKTTRAPIELSSWPDFIEDRIALFDKLMIRYNEEVAAKSWRTTPLMIAEQISRGVADSAVVAKVNGEVWDLDRPFEGDANLQILNFDDDEENRISCLMMFLSSVVQKHICTDRSGPKLKIGQSYGCFPVFWHSSAHIMGEAMERYCGGHLCYGPPISEGFYYDMWKEGASITPDDFPKLEQIIKCVVKDKQPFERLVVSKEDLLQMFKYNKFKVRIISEKITTPFTTVYRCGPLIDLCRGPHVRHTGKVKALTVTKTSSSYWEGRSDAESLIRIYGMSFPDSKQLKEWQKLQEEAAKRDHRKIGRDQDFPGSAFWYPKGAHIYNALCNFIRKEYRKRGFTEVISPNMYNSKLWEQSGHWEHYSDNMFKIDIEKETFGLKPMNCPGHCLMYSHLPRTHNELPLRYADFGVLHRNEMSGALTGLTRVRRFQQDDGHIFACIDFLKYVYIDVFGFAFKMNLSTRPEVGYLGDIETWNSAEDKLKEALDASGHKWELNSGDGAFMIDITIQDALRRFHQCATIQLDFQLPLRFDLSYFDGELWWQMAIWLSPRQAKVITVHESQNTYARMIYEAGFEVEFDADSSDTLNKQIRNAQIAQFNFILVIGPAETRNGTVNVRTRDNAVRGEVKLEDLIEKFKRFQEEFIRDTESAEQF
ncbi:Threonine--tRNA ligase, cytoplasmic [Dirofilaria immitis]|nr:Threonine--tRNA ligase, cytoplasmic [Dirofilaria immitis]